MFKIVHIPSASVIRAWNIPDRPELKFSRECDATRYVNDDKTMVVYQNGDITLVPAYLREHKLIIKEHFVVVEDDDESSTYTNSY